MAENTKYFKEKKCDKKYIFGMLHRSMKIRNIEILQISVLSWEIIF